MPFKSLPRPLASAVWSSFSGVFAPLLKQVIPKPAAAGWYVFAVVYMAAVKLAAALVHRLATGEWPAFGDTLLFLVAASILISTFR